MSRSQPTPAPLASRSEEDTRGPSSEPSTELASYLAESQVTARLASYRAEAGPLPSPGVDEATGKLIAISDEERKARIERLRRTLAEIDAGDDTPEEADRQFLRNLDETRRLEGRPPAFEGLD